MIHEDIEKGLNANEIIVYKKDGLKEAMKKGYEKIIVKGELAEKLNKTKVVAKLSKKKLALITAAIGVGTALIPFTGGASLAVSGFTGVAATTGIAVSTIILASSIGIALIIAVYNGDYDVKVIHEATEFTMTKKQKNNL